MPINFPIVPLVPGVPALQAFPGAASLVGSINGNIATINSGIGSVTAGLSLSGAGIALGTTFTSGLTSIQDTVGGIAGLATVNISQVVPQLSMLASGSLSGLLDSATSILDGDSISAIVGAGGAQWGLFLDGALVLQPDSFVAIDYKSDWHISDYPIEQGNFASYNKVRLPYETRVTFTKGGTQADREAFLATVKAIAGSLDLYDVVTPEVTYTNANIVHYDYSRKSDNGATLLTVAIWLQEIRVEATSSLSPTATPAAISSSAIPALPVAFPQINLGNVQAAAATAVQNAIFAGHGATGSF